MLRSHHNNYESQLDYSAATVSDSKDEVIHNSDNSTIFGNNLTTMKSNEASTTSVYSCTDDQPASNKEWTINYSGTHNNSNGTHCNQLCIDGSIITNEGCNHVTNNLPTLSFQKQINQYREKHQFYFCKTS